MFVKLRRKTRSVSNFPLRKRAIEFLEPRRLLIAEPLISEFMAINSSTLQDEDGDFSDWIELTNAGDEQVSLDGYWISDDPNNLTKWRFPDIMLQPASHLVLFASGKDRDDPVSQLHTNFRLNGDGESLSLVAPDGQTIVHQFAPEYPTQVADIGYGIATSVVTTTLIDTGAAGSYLVPTDDSLQEQWFRPAFDDSGWESGATPIGYDTGQRELPQFAEAVVQLQPLAYWRFEETEGTTALNLGSLGAELDATYESSPALTTAGPGSDQASLGLGGDNSAVRFDGIDDAVTTGQSILNNLSQFTMMGFVRPNALTGSNLGLFGQNDVIGFGFNRTDSLQISTGPRGRTARLRTDYTLPTDEWHHVAAVGTGEKLQIYIDGQLVEELDNLTENYGESDDGFNIGGGGIFRATGNYIGAEIDEVAVFDKALTGEQIAGLLSHTPTLGGDFDELIATNVQDSLLNTSSSLYVRIPFDVDNPQEFNRLTLQIQYDDAFVAYLNGAEIVRRNAAGEVDIPLAHDTVALTSHLDVAAVAGETIDISDSRDLLLPGQNILAIHGLNVSADNTDFLLAPMLEAALVTPDASRVGYLTTPSSGEINNPVSENLGPVVAEVNHLPHQPTVTDATVVTAEVVRTLEDVARVELTYRVMFGDEVTIPMADDGSGDDATAGDGLYTATIPAGLAQPGEMLRWYVRATDVVDAEGREPKFEFRSGNNQSPEYLGTMIVEPSVSSNLPILHWFVENERAAGTEGGTRASLYYDGEFYDNMFVRQRGGSTRNNVLGKTNFKFDFKGNQFRFDPQYARVEEFNINTTASDKAYLRQSMTFEAHTVLGAPTSLSFPMHVRRNNEFYGVFVFIEEPSEEMLEREGFDPNGALYKMRNEFTAARGNDKKTRREEEGIADLEEFVSNINSLEGEALSNYLFDTVDIPLTLNYFVATVLTHQNDNPHKNHYLYRDSDGSGEWFFLPWDNDLTWGSNWAGSSFLDVIYADDDVITEGPVPSHPPAVIHPSHPFINTEEYREWNNHWNRLMDALLTDPIISEMYLRRLRSGMDLFLGEPGTTDSYFDQRFDWYAENMAADAQLDYERWNNPWKWGEDQSFQQAIDVIKNEYLEVRRQHLYETHNVANLQGGDSTVLIAPSAQAKYFTPSDDSLGTDWTMPTFDDSSWASGELGIGFDESRRMPIIDLVTTTVKPADGATSVFLRIPFNVDDPAAVEQLTLRMKYDDAFVAYLNGVELARGNLRDDPTFNVETRSRQVLLVSFYDDFDISEHAGLLQPGENVLAIQGIMRRPSDDEAVIIPELIEGHFSSVAIAGIPDGQAGNPTITFDQASFDVNPASGNQDEEYLKLDNPNDQAVDISGWSLTGAIEHTLKPGTVIPAGGSLYVSPNVRDFRARQTGPSGGQGLFVQGNYQGHLSNYGETVQLFAADGTLMDALSTPANPSDQQQFLRITEINYNPSGLDDATEFIELKNISSGATATTLDLTGVILSQGPREAFALPQGTSLAPGEYLVIVGDTQAFQAAYPQVDPAKILGPFVGNISNQGERIKLEDLSGSTIVDFSFGDNDPWPESADGAGATLVLIDPASTPYDQMGKHYHWRGSTEAGGSPGADPADALGVVVNEVLTNTDAPNADDDAIELLNTTGAEIDISGWYLSDSRNDLLKYRIPDGTVLGAGQYAVISESQFNPSPQNRGPKHFALDGEGDDVWLVVSNDQGTVSSFVDDVHYGAADAGVTLGRAPNGTGRLAPMTGNTLGSANARPLVGPLVISEIQYNPTTPAAVLPTDPDVSRDDAEFIEIHNPTEASVDLTGWSIRGGIDFDFADDAQLGAGQSVVIISFNPDSRANSRRLATLKAHYGFDENVALLGGYAGQLDNSGEVIQLLRPNQSSANDPTSLAHVLVDEVLYDDLSPWPRQADGTGDSLTRVDVSGQGNLPTSWTSAAASPGSAEFAASLKGDSNGDGVFNQLDIVAVLQAGKYLSGEPATFAEGDWNGDGVFNQLDVVAALQQDSYQPGAMEALRVEAYRGMEPVLDDLAPSAPQPHDPRLEMVDDVFARIGLRKI